VDRASTVILSVAAFQAAPGDLLLWLGDPSARSLRSPPAEAGGLLEDAGVRDDNRYVNDENLLLLGRLLLFAVTGFDRGIQRGEQIFRLLRIGAGGSQI
jgi:hypothetical protein